MRKLVEPEPGTAWINVRTFLDVRILLRTYGMIIKDCPSGFRTDS